MGKGSWGDDGWVVMDAGIIGNLRYHDVNIWDIQQESVTGHDVGESIFIKLKMSRTFTSNAMTLFSGLTDCTYLNHRGVRAQNRPKDQTYLSYQPEPRAGKALA